MKNITCILFFILLALIGCEDVYIANLDIGGDMLVVEAKLQAGSSGNVIKINHTVGFYDNENYPPVSGARVYLIDDKKNISLFADRGAGMYFCNTEINAVRQYKLQILYDGESYESAFEKVPELPDIDTVYGEAITKTIVSIKSDGNKVLETVDGIQLYVDINNDAPKYYRFYARKVLLSNFQFDTVMGTPVTVTKYVWQSLYPLGSFNIAAPAKYLLESNINKHPVEFFKARNQGLMAIDLQERERGWIYIMHQYSIPVSGYHFYEVLNKQLESEGKIFDPIYSQAFGNIKCITNKDRIILGNFEIYNYREHRYFLKVINNENDFLLRKIETFYNIPNSGIKSVDPPVFWEK